MQLYNFNGVPAIRNVNPDKNNNAPPSASLASVPYLKMHRRLLHASEAVVDEACKRSGITLCHKGDDVCEGCICGKMADELGKQAPIQGSEPLHFIRVDMVKHNPPAMLGYRYSVHIIDVYSNYHWVKFAKTKQECFAALQDWVTMVQNQTNRTIKMIGIDGGTEFGQATRPFIHDKFKKWARAFGFVVLQTPPHTPWMNGKIECATRDVPDKCRVTRIALNIPEHLWTFIMETVIQVKNTPPISANPGLKSPHEGFAEGVNMPEAARKPYISHFRAYFCDAY